jgi:hypothetical protein
LKGRRNVRRGLEVEDINVNNEDEEQEMMTRSKARSKLEKLE